MTGDWTPLKAELAIWRAEGRPLPLWWRDDDAIEDTPALAQLSAMATELHLPVHLAVIPKPAQPSLVAACEGSDVLVPVVHGWAHQNHAPEGAKKAEFGHPRADALIETKAALERMRTLFGSDVLAMFVPPWNRLDVGICAGLAQQGYQIVSAFTPRTAPKTAGLTQINTHIDPIFWRGGGGLVDPETLIAEIVKTLQDRRAGVSDAGEPLGLLTHHLVHDVAIWDFTKACLTTLLEGGATPCNLTHMRNE